MILIHVLQPAPRLLFSMMLDEAVWPFEKIPSHKTWYFSDAFTILLNLGFQIAEVLFFQWSWMLWGVLLVGWLAAWADQPRQPSSLYIASSLGVCHKLTALFSGKSPSRNRVGITSTFKADLNFCLWPGKIVFPSFSFRLWCPMTQDGSGTRSK